jgi:hypothetical protein
LGIHENIAGNIDNIIIIKSLKEETQRKSNAKTEVQHEIMGQMEPSQNQF